MSDYSKLLDILATLVGLDTVSGNHTAVNNLFEYVEKRIDGFGLHSNRYLSNGFESLVISTQPGKRSSVILQAHIDVVPGYPEQFQLQQHDGKLFGRGVYDMKFAAACFVHLLEDLKPQLANYDIAVMLTSDEELGGANGVAHLLNQGYKADVCILPDSGENWKIEASAKGFAIVDIIARGKSAHGSRPWEADNAALKLVDFLSVMGQTFPFTAPLETTVSLTRLLTGPAYNQIPGEASATFDIRYPDDEQFQALQKKINTLCKEYDMEADFTPLAGSMQHDVHSPYLETWQAVTTKITGKEPTYTHSFGSSDARYFMSQNITTISARPTGGGAHAPGEWIAEEDFYEFYEVVKQFVLTTGTKQIDT